VVAVGSGTAWAPHSLKALSHAKRINPDIVTVAGGLHFTGYPDGSLKECADLDYVVIGEGEYTLLELIEEIKKGNNDPKNVRGLAYRENGDIRFTPPRPLIENLDELPLPAYHLLPMDRYKLYTYWNRAIRIVVSRGCLGRCNFCFQWRQYDTRLRSNIGRYRVKSAKRVVDEMELLNKKFGIRIIDIEDDSFNGDRKRMEEICDEIIKRNLKINWFFLGRADDFVRDADLLPKMREAGCFMALVGIEVESDESLEKVGKKVRIAQIKDAVKKLRDNGIATWGTYIVGFWDDNEEVVKRRLEVADEIDPDAVVVQALTPMPGTLLWDEVKDTDLIKISDWSFFDTAHAIMPTKYLTVDEVNYWAAWSYEEFFKRKNRVDRALNSEYIHPLAKLCIRSFIEMIPKVRECTVEGKSFL
jgi:radical SAM superfamily enzyme YgiQ (UPF0313 family)